MNIRISTEALTGSDTELLWPGALYGLKRLQQLDHTLFFITDTLSPLEVDLLDNEKISAAGISSDEVDLQIIADDSQLKAIDAEGIEMESAKNWISLSNKICFPTRKATVKRTTSETDISISVNLDGTSESSIDTGLGFFDHMLEQIAKHGLVDLEISCDGDLEIDEHHTIEDVAITLGETISKALGNKVGIQRYGFALPMDETLATVALDFSGRPYLVFDGTLNREYVGDFPTEMTEHFFYSLAMNLKATLNISVEGENDHHKIEACFKAFARCLRAAISRNERNANILPSTKDLL
ncbi:imidazoleglycerol-phosphate dehydratase HisB [Fodinibius halophilus]|uniref:Imidazoleglycerol-phosphate dehydratase n=1 Tax=Fodinibius halophilus TaxID=1736908 RepID=A0A6M1TAL8_9BACT|nr:imidazoleglycerol-phosphate dehydratase HisB [Fodinibius halophilus]NGP89463.1 imidazoleglycerol-phosphate dehydratase HisB [Fodinibius halophilus]